MTHDNTSPQVEDGHTRLANELLEAMCLAGFSARQWAIVMAVVRKTYGYGKKSDDISLGQLSSMTGIAKPHASRAVNSLVAAGVLRRSAGTFGNSLSLNKRYKQWSLVGPAAGVTDSVTLGLPKEQRWLPIQQPQDGVTDPATAVTDLATCDRVTESVTGVTNLATGVADSAAVTESVTLGLPIRQPQKETLQKKEKHPPIPPKGEEGDPEGFAEAWAAYPKRQGGNPRGTAVKAWKARLRSSVMATEMIAGVRGYAAHCRAEGKVGTSFVMMAATFFGPDLRFRDFAESPAGPGPQGASRSAGVIPGSPLDIDTNPVWLAQTGYASVWEAISDGCTEHTYRQFRDGKRVPKEAA
ncbi:replication protein [Achromobacter sp. ACM04]|uniref:replication protein n=1 Tax=Achromobacter sp. ACM04 TaxID=2769312 RepID=UPI00177CAA31|nr:replication protein [Achromobacter sp. ACM04]MBD9419834.1 replication protein [Achromobacter sp. ACM04]